MINKIFDNIDETVQDVENGNIILMGGFGGAGVPYELMSSLYRQGSTELICVSNNPGFYEEGLAELIKNNRVAKLMCSFPLSKESYVFIEKYRTGKVDLELIPQGTMAERIRAGGSGIEAFYTPTGTGTEIAEGKNEKKIDGVNCLLEKAIKANFAFVKAKKADRWGNLIYNKSGRNFNPLMAMAANVTIAEVDEIVEVGELDPESIITPGIFVQRVFKKGHS